MPESASPAPASVQVWRALQRVYVDLRPELDSELRRTTGLPASWYDMLVELSGPQRLRMSDLGACMVLSRTRVSRLVGELEGRGLVRRECNPADGRSAYVAITAAGWQQLHEATPYHRAAIDQHFAGLPDGELETLVTALHKVIGAPDEDQRQHD
ncbi:putative transcriptional regulator, MarR family [Nocardia nova SH22a]|uniref:Putative transcriptional regulator, MarR family n=1 Tax=Nocardia nova SH22a TaxID=1415166 RepID=W5TAE5_9NOCA|nr:MarR family winged helix-turn-helix transcriptional regulator [Nocardia nova]AHH16114.1 putative transcriptional regulator, MarR family [Nocardia nova SH22a]